MSLYHPYFTKVITPTIDSYLCGGRYKNFLSVIPVNGAKSTLKFIPTTKQYFKANTDFISNISVQLVEENGMPINFTICPPTITKIRFK